MSMRRILLAAALSAGLPACSPGEPEATASQAPEAKTVSAVGTVIGVDPPNGTITLQHGPIAELGWPAMRMAFKAPPEAIAAVQDGDRVAFDLKLAGGQAEIVAVRAP